MTSCTLTIRLKPRSKRPGIVSISGGVVQIAVSAPPVEGNANEAMIRLLAEVLSVPKSAIALMRGAASRNKTVAVAGIASATAIDILRRSLGRS